MQWHQTQNLCSLVSEFQALGTLQDRKQAPSLLEPVPIDRISQFDGHGRWQSFRGIQSLGKMIVNNRFSKLKSVYRVEDNRIQTSTLASVSGIRMTDEPGGLGLRLRKALLGVLPQSQSAFSADFPGKWKLIHLLRNLISKHELLQ